MRIRHPPWHDPRSQEGSAISGSSPGTTLGLLSEGAPGMRLVPVSHPYLTLARTSEGSQAMAILVPPCPSPTVLGLNSPSAPLQVLPGLCGPGAAVLT